MNKHLENALWQALENAVKDKDISSASELIQHLMPSPQESEPPPKDIPEDSQSKPSENTSPKIDKPKNTPYHREVTRVAAFNLDRKYDLVDTFLSQVKGEYFTLNEFKDFVKKFPHYKEMKEAAPYWESYIGDCFSSYWSKTKSTKYKGIKSEKKQGLYRKPESMANLFPFPPAQ